jgi:sporulation protein YlmC with PRC-barrel domain
MDTLIWGTQLRAKDIIGKKVIDTGGNEIGEVEDVEIEWDNKAVTGIIIGGQGETAQRLFGRLGARSTPDITIPVEQIIGMGEVIIIKPK